MLLPVIMVWLRDKEKLHDFVDMINPTDQMKRKRPELAKTLNFSRQFSHGL